MIASLRALVSTYQAPNIRIELTGPPVWKGELLRAALNDQLMFMGIGVLLGFLTALLAFRTFWGALLATLAPAITALWVTGCIILIFGAFTFLTNIISALVLVIAFAESMYFCFYWLRLWQAGADPKEALSETVKKVSPACALTAITTIVAFLTLALAPGQGLQEFAISGAIGMAIAFVALVTFLPLSLLVALWFGYSTRRAPSVALTAPIPLVRRLVRAAPRRIAILSLIAAAMLLVPHVLLEPRFSFQDYLPRGSDSLQTSQRIDTGVGGVAPVYIRIPLSGGIEEMSDDDFALVELVHGLAEEHFGRGKVISAASFRHYSESGFSRQQILGSVSPFLQRRFLSEDGTEAMITAFSPTSQDASQTQSVIEAVRADLARAGLTDVEISGFRVLTAYATISMISTLQLSLGLAVLASVLLIGIAFRSWKIALVSLIPNALPILITEAILYSSGIQLQLTTVISLTVAFGIAVDDTIHFLAHYVRARERGASVADAVDSTLDRVGPALIATTLILIAGCAVLMISALPQVALFGMLTVISLLAALIGDLVVLPALLIGGGRLYKRWSDRTNEATA
nr:MMPL family transporter [Pelagibacterium limicola]